MRKLISSTAVQGLVLIITALATYYHDLYGVARADQLIYFYRTVRMNDFWSLTFGAFDFNRAHSAGDYVLFRPVLYFLLGVEKWLWGYNMLAWQATSLGLHVAVVLSLFAYLRGCLADAGVAPKSSWLPFAVSAFLATLYAGSEMVAWQHLAGYLLFCLLLVQSAIRYRVFASRPSVGRAAVLVAFASLAAFTYELGVVALAGFAALCALAALRSKVGGRIYTLTSLALVLMVLAYVSADYLNSQAATRELPHGTIREIAQADAAYAARWVGEILLPSEWTLSPGSRITTDFNPGNPNLGNRLIVAALIFGAIAAQTSRKRLGDVRSGAMFLCLGVVYTTLIVLDRALPRGLDSTFIHNSYYAYTFALVFLVSAFHLVFTPADRSTGKIARISESLMVVALLLVAAIGAYKTSDLLFRERYEYAEPIATLIHRINGLIRQHGDELDFSFTVTPDCKGNTELPWFSTQTTVNRVNYPVAWVMYPRYERDSGGKYTVPCGNP